MNVEIDRVVPGECGKARDRQIGPDAEAVDRVERGVIVRAPARRQSGDRTA